MKIMFFVKVLTGVGTEKVENINNSWKSVIFLKNAKFLKILKILVNFTKIKKFHRRLKTTAIP